MTDLGTTGSGKPIGSPRRRLADRLLAEGTLVAQQFAGQDRLDPARPTLGQLVAEAIAAAEQRGRDAVRAEADAHRDALADLLGAVERHAGRWATGDEDAVRDAAARARRHLDRTEGL